MRPKSDRYLGALPPWLRLTECERVVRHYLGIIDVAAREITDPEEVEYALDDLYYLATILADASAALRQKQKVAKLRETAGRTEAEAAAFNAKADALEAAPSGA